MTTAATLPIRILTVTDSQNRINMYEGTEEIIRIDKDGFYYRGEFIADAGMAHRLLITYLQRHTSMHPEIVQKESNND